MMKRKNWWTSIQVNSVQPNPSKVSMTESLGKAPIRLCPASSHFKWRDLWCLWRVHHSCWIRSVRRMRRTLRRRMTLCQINCILQNWGWAEGVVPLQKCWGSMNRERSGQGQRWQAVAVLMQVTLMIQRNAHGRTNSSQNSCIGETVVIILVIRMGGRQDHPQGG